MASPARKSELREMAGDAPAVYDPFEKAPVEAPRVQHWQAFLDTAKGVSGSPTPSPSRQRSMSIPLNSKDANAVSALFNADISAIAPTTVDDSVILNASRVDGGGDAVHVRNDKPIRMFLMDSSFDEHGVPLAGDQSSIHTDPDVRPSSPPSVHRTATAIPDSDVDDLDSRMWEESPPHRRSGGGGVEEDDDVVVFMSSNQEEAPAEAESVLQPSEAVRPLEPVVTRGLSSPPRIRRVESPSGKGSPSTAAVPVSSAIAAPSPPKSSPDGLASEWRSATAPDGRVYYYRQGTKQSVWVRPNVEGTIKHRGTYAPKTNDAKVQPTAATTPAARPTPTGANTQPKSATAPAVAETPTVVETPTAATPTAATLTPAVGSRKAPQVPPSPNRVCPFCGIHGAADLMAWHVAGCAKDRGIKSTEMKRAELTARKASPARGMRSREVSPSPTAALTPTPVASQAPPSPSVGASPAGPQTAPQVSTSAASGQRRRYKSAPRGRRRPSPVPMATPSPKAPLGTPSSGLMQCDDCGRSFLPDRLEKHSKVCKSVFGQKRAVFDAHMRRVKDTPAAAFQHYEPCNRCGLQFSTAEASRLHALKCNRTPRRRRRTGSKASDEQVSTPITGVAEPAEHTPVPRGAAPPPGSLSLLKRKLRRPLADANSPAPGTVTASKPVSPQAEQRELHGAPPAATPAAKTPASVPPPPSGILRPGFATKGLRSPSPTPKRFTSLPVRMLMSANQLPSSPASPVSQQPAVSAAPTLPAPSPAVAHLASPALPSSPTQTPLPATAAVHPAFLCGAVPDAVLPEEVAAMAATGTHSFGDAQSRPSTAASRARPRDDDMASVVSSSSSSTESSSSSSSSEEEGPRVHGGGGVDVSKFDNDLSVHTSHSSLRRSAAAAVAATVACPFCEEMVAKESLSTHLLSCEDLIASRSEYRRRHPTLLSPAVGSQAQRVLNFNESAQERSLLQA